MPFEPITQLAIENYGCIRKATFALTPLHAFIGPNDSGKSTILRALRTIALCATEDQPGRKVEQEFQTLWGDKSKISVICSDQATYRVEADHQGPRHFQIAYQQNAVLFGIGRSWEGPHYFSGDMNEKPRIASVWERLAHATMVRFDPNALRKPANQILASEPIRLSDEMGTGLASVYQAINSRDVDAFVRIRDRVKDFFPTVQSILVPTIENNQVVLQARLTDNTLVSAEAMSEGLLYFLGFMALQYLGESRLFLVEEPENGLHPSRIADIMAILREISKSSQVVIATHSPLVVNELTGDEVSVVTRDPATGTNAKLLKDVPDFEDKSKIYQPGELWLSYADGKMETPLLEGKPRP
jgi:predicted ATPase